MRKLTALFVATTFALGAANLAYAADTTMTPAAKIDASGVHYKGPCGGHHDMMFKNLNLTDAQKQQVRDIMKQQGGKMDRPSLDQRRAAHSIIASDSFDAAKAQAEVNRVAGQNKTRMLAHMQTQNKIYNILTPEQKKQFNANFEKRLTERPKHKGRMLIDQE